AGGQLWPVAAPLRSQPGPNGWAGQVSGAWQRLWPVPRLDRIGAGPSQAGGSWPTAKGPGLTSETTSPTPCAADEAAGREPAAGRRGEGRAARQEQLLHRQRSEEVADRRAPVCPGGVRGCLSGRERDVLRQR